MLKKILNLFKTSIVVNKGTNNYIINFDDDGNCWEVKYIKNLKVMFLGSNNIIKIHKDTHFNNIHKFSCSSDNKIFIDKTSYDINILVPYVMSKGSKLIIGKNFSCGITQFRLHCESNLKVIVGNDCMFSENIFIKPSDGHTIYYQNTKKIINKPQNIIIGNHVWIGRNAVILKGAYIPDNSVIGIGSIYTKSTNDMESNNLYVGIPAKKIKQNINWNRFDTENFEQYNTI